ncbi:unnamed protein product [Dibothriocephalus latus]|uniref:Uncharacterized protein n=1 Tax=Dibothriocephalus latus TaxID=60516 RepID=A0A3P7RMZ9_DIBLA|nr:unnamed protein product [Dibothriocephalus latus]
MKDTCLATSVTLIIETEPSSTPTKEGKEEVTSTSMIMMNSTLTEEVSSLRPSLDEVPAMTAHPSPPTQEEEPDQETALSRVRASLQTLANDLPRLPREVHKDILFEALAALKSIM